MGYCKGLEFSSQHLHQKTPNTVTPVLETPEASDLPGTTCMLPHPHTDAHIYTEPKVIKIRKKRKGDRRRKT